jgi:hypothetical protein
MNARIIHNHITDSAKEFFEHQFPGWSVSSLDCLEITFDDLSSTTYVIFSGPHTCQNMCRDCIDHFEIYHHSGILTVDKRTLQIKFQNS